MAHDKDPHNSSIKIPTPIIETFDKILISKLRDASEFPIMWGLENYEVGRKVSTYLRL